MYKLLYDFKIIGSGNGVSENNTGSKDVLTAALHVVKGNDKLSADHAIYKINTGNIYAFTMILH